MQLPWRQQSLHLLDTKSPREAAIPPRRPPNSRQQAFTQKHAHECSRQRQLGSLVTECECPTPPAHGGPIHTREYPSAWAGSDVLTHDNVDEP